mmetsp:Transcript_17163/g.33644  ORF Transcript_17163/g.33644 Transcript_17163/m.33644 type:complete len:291 (+) Transcript_17163:250-1122(+)
MAGKAVHEDPVISGLALGHELAGDLVSLEGLDTLGGFLFLAHGDPSISNNNVAAIDTLNRVGSNPNIGVVLLGKGLRVLHNTLVRAVAFRGADAKVHTHGWCGEHEVVKNIVAITDPCEGLASNVFGAKVLLDGHVISKCLERVVHVAEGVNYRHGGVLCELGHNFVAKNTGQDQRVKAGQHKSRVLDSLVDAKLDILRGQEQRVSSEEVHASLSRHTGASGSLLKDAGHRFALECLRDLFGLAEDFDVPGKRQHCLQFFLGVVVNPHQMLALEALENLTVLLSVPCGRR